MSGLPIPASPDLVNSRAQVCHKHKDRRASGTVLPRGQALKVGQALTKRIKQ